VFSLLIWLFRHHLTVQNLRCFSFPNPLFEGFWKFLELLFIGFFTLETFCSPYSSCSLITRYLRPGPLDDAESVQSFGINSASWAFLGILRMFNGWSFWGHRADGWWLPTFLLPSIRCGEKKVLQFTFQSSPTWYRSAPLWALFCVMLSLQSVT
jgi:hypothetical protein